MKVLTSTGKVLVVGGTLVHGCADSIDGIETHFRRSVPCHTISSKDARERERYSHQVGIGSTRSFEQDRSGVHQSEPDFRRSLLETKQLLKVVDDNFDDLLSCIDTVGTRVST